jgi:glycosyltransferase involved in cell wall biosynthesis
MVIFSEKETGSVVAFISSGCNLQCESSELLSSMFPEDDGIECHDIKFDYSGSMHGCRIEKEDSVIIKIVSGGNVIYQMSPEEIEREKMRFKQERMKEIMEKCLIKESPSLKRIVEHHVHRYPDEEALSSIDDGSFFESLSVVGWYGPIVDASGYGNMNREIVQRLYRHGIMPIVGIYPTSVLVPKSIEEAIRDYSRLKCKIDSYPYIHSLTPYIPPPHGGKRVFYTMMETSTLHPEIVRSCNKFSDEVWLPSMANKQLFEEHGVKKPMRVLPLGIDGNIYLKKDIDRNRIDLSKCKSVYGTPPSDHVGAYRFLTVVQWNIRKGYDALIKAYFQTFTKDDDVCLVIATQYSTETVRNTLDKYVKEGADSPQVIHCDGIIPVNDMPYVYDACDCYIHLSRGEGFSLTQVEAAARRLPVISCYHSGMTEYMTRDNSYIVECNADEECFPELAAISCYYPGQRMWRVGNEQIEQASHYMKHVIANPEDASERADRMHNLVKSEFTWDVAVERVASAIKKL